MRFGHLEVKRHVTSALQTVARNVLWLSDAHNPWANKSCDQALTVLSLPKMSLNILKVFRIR